MSQQSNHKEVEDAFRILDGLGKASPSEDFENRLFAKLSDVSQEPDKPSISPWMRWSVAALITLSLTNVFVIFQMQSSVDEPDLQSLWVDSTTETYYGEEILTIVAP